jgi:hypothetical protein
MGRRETEHKEWRNSKVETRGLRVVLRPGRVSAFRPQGVLGPTSKLSPRVPAQMGRRETEHKGGRNSKGETRGLRVVLRLGRVRLQ